MMQLPTLGEVLVTWPSIGFDMQQNFSNNNESDSHQLELLALQSVF